MPCKARLTTVYDNYSQKSGLKTGHGFACLVELEDSTILFDTGTEPATLLGNMESLGKNPEDIDVVVLSHDHWDHTGGLEELLKIKEGLKVYVCPGFGQGLKSTITNLKGKPIETGGITEITENAFLTGEIPGIYKGIHIPEQSLLLRTSRGITLITGCSHPGIIRIAERVKEELPGEKIYLALGGFHLGDKSDTELRSIISAFRKLGVEKLAPCHCSGERTRELFREEYGKDFVDNGVGKVIEL